MEGHDSLLFQILVLLSATVLAVPVFHRLGIGPVLGYLAAGVAVGPHALGMVADVEDIRSLGELGVVFLLFAIGLELKLSRLWVMRRMVFGLGSAQVVVTGAALAAISWLAGGVPLTAAVVIGGGLALSSTAVVLQMLMERGELTTRSGRIAFAVLLMQDLAVVPLLMLVGALSGSSADSPPQAMAFALGRGVIAGGLIVGVGRLVVRPFLKAVAASHSAEAFTAAAVLVVLGTGWVTAQAGLSMALGAFLAGLLLAETEFRHQIEADIQPFRGFLLGLFFMTVGMALDVPLLISDWPGVLLMLLALVAIKAALLAGLALAFGLGAEVAVQVGLLLAQGGEFAFVLFGASTRAGLMPADLTRVLTLAVTASMMLTPLLACLAAPLAERFRHPSGDVGRLDNVHGLRGHVILAGFGRVGQTVARLLERRDIPYLALDLQPDRVVAARARGMPVFFADACLSHVLRTAGAERALAVVLTLDRPGTTERAMAVLRQQFPHLPVFARARDHDHGRVLRRAGAAAAVPETIEASLQLAAVVLQAAGTPPDDLSALLAEARRNNYAGLDAVARGEETA